MRKTWGTHAPGPCGLSKKGRPMEATSGVARRISARWFVALLSAFLLLSYGPIRVGLIAIADACTGGSSAQGTDNNQGNNDQGSGKSSQSCTCKTSAQSTDNGGNQGDNSKKQKAAVEAQNTSKQDNN